MKSIPAFIIAWILIFNFEKFSSVQSDTPKSWRQEGVDAHNKYRRYHNVPLLKMGDKEMCDYSQNWADMLANGNGRGSSMSTMYGENLWSKNITSIPSVQDVVRMWYNEVKNYNFNITNVTSSKQTDFKTGHFIQIVWKKTTSVCVSYAIGVGKEWTSVVANYFPLANTQGGEMEQNVLHGLRNDNSTSNNGNGNMTSMYFKLLVLTCGSMVYLNVW